MRIIRKGGVDSVLLFLIANFISISELNPGLDNAELLQLRSHARPHRYLLKMLGRSNKNPPKTTANSIPKIEPDTHRIFSDLSTTAVLEGSMIAEDETLDVPSFLKNTGRESTDCLCSDPSPDAGTLRRTCSTTCTTSETLCGRTCARSTTYAAVFSLFSGEQWQWSSKVPVSVIVTSTYSQVVGKECEKLESECIMSSALTEARKLAGAAVALSGGIAVGVIGLAATLQKQKYFNISEAGVEPEIQNRVNRSPTAETALKSSIEEELEIPTFLRMKRQNIGCTCEVSIPLWGQQECSTTCLSSEQICGHFCIRTSVFQAIAYLVSSTNAVTTRTFLTIDKSDCDKLEVDCIGSSAIVAAAKAGAVSAVVTGALSAAIAAGAVAFALAPTPVKITEINKNGTEEYKELNIPLYGKLIDSSKNQIFRRKRRRLMKNKPVGFFESLMSKLKSWLIVFSSSALTAMSKSENLSKTGLNEYEKTNNVNTSALLESSITPSIDDKRNHVNFERQISLSLCSCADPNPGLTTQESAYYGRICSTTCTTTKTLCNGQICTRTTTFTALFTRYLGLQTLGGTLDLVSGTVTKKFEQIDETSCVVLESECVASSALAEARMSGAIAVGGAVALSAGIGIGSIALAMAGMKSKEKFNTEGHHPAPEFYHARRNKRKVKSTYDLSQKYFDVEGHQTHEPTDHPEELSRSLHSKESFTQWLQQLMNRMLWKPKNNVRHRTRNSESNRLHEMIGQPDIESSISLELRRRSFGFRRQDAGYTCVTASGDCTTTCLSSEMLCGGYCTRTSIFEDCIYLNSTQAVSPPTSSSPAPEVDDDGRDIGSFYVTKEKDCEKLEANCMAKSAIVSAGCSGEIAAGISGALSAGMAIIAAVVSLNNNNNQQNQQSNENQPNNNQPSGNNQIPVNNLPIPVTGLDFPKDGCDDGSVRFADGNCHPVLSRGPCNETNRWVTIDPVSLQGRCSPRLCTDDRRVFVGRTGLCHDINDPNECQGGRRLYSTAYGDSICDCPIGQYPFPNSTHDDCVSLFTQGPCPDEQVVTISQGGRLFCGPAECSFQSPMQQMIPTEKGECYALGSQGFCANNSQVLGYDIFKRQLQCVIGPASAKADQSSNRKASDSRDSLHSSRKVQMKLDYQNFLIKTTDETQERRRQDNGGIFQFPGSSVSTTKIDFLLQPCRTGARQGLNHKCANPLVPDLSTASPTRPPVSPAFTCPRNGSFLQAGGQCVNDNRATSCGPSFQFNEATGQCRPRF